MLTQSSSSELLNLCDSLGVLVVDESFDSWLQGKTPYDYSLYFKSWFERDLRDMVLRDRNHPSIILWSIGNEVLEQWNKVNNSGMALGDVNILLNNTRDKSALSHRVIPSILIQSLPRLWLL